MHIVQVVESFGGGVVPIVCSIVEECRGAGWRSTVFYALRAETPKNYEELFDKDVTLRRLVTGRSINGILDAVDAIRIASYVKTNNVNVIHGHSSKGGAIARAAALMSRRPALYTPHGFSFIGPAGENTNKFTFYVERILGKLPGEFVCCSESEARVARALSESVSVIPNFIDIAALRSSASGVDQKQCDVITAGRISKQKNAPLFMEVARSLPHLRFVWIGGPHEKLDQPAPGNVEVTGWIDRKDALRRIASSRIFLSTSRYEGMPVAMMEALALGLPVVTTNVPGSRDIIEHGVNGLLCEKAEDILASVRRLTEDSIFYEESARNAVKHAAARFDHRVILASWIDKYKNVASC